MIPFRFFVTAACCICLCAAAPGHFLLGDNPKAAVDASGDPLPKGVIARMGRLQLQHDDEITTAAVSRDAKLAATCNRTNKTIHVFDLALNKRLQTISGHAGFMLFSPNGKTLLIDDGAKSIIFNLAEKKSKEIQATRISFVANDNTLAAIKSQNNAGIVSSSVSFYDATSGRELRAWPALPGDILRICFSADGKQCVTGSSDGELSLRNIENGKPIRFIANQRNSIVDLAFSRDGKHLASASLDDTVRLWEVESGNQVWRNSLHPIPASLFFSKDDKAIYGTAGKGEAFVIDKTTGKTHRVINGNLLYPGNKANNYEITAFALAADAEAFFTFHGPKGVVHQWDVKTGRVVAQPGSTLGLYALAFSHDGKSLAAGTGAGGIDLWEAATGKSLRRFENKHLDFVRTLGFSPDGKTLVSGAGKNDFSAIVWNVENGQVIRQLPGHSKGVNSVQFSPDGMNIFTAPASGSVLQSWASDSGKKLQRVEWRQYNSFGYALSPNGKYLAYYGYNEEKPEKDEKAALVILNLKDGTKSRIEPPSNLGPIVLAFSPDGETLLTGKENDKSLILWHIPSRAKVLEITAPRDAAEKQYFGDYPSFVCFGADGRTVAASFKTKTVRVWETATGLERRKLQAHESVVTAGSFSPDGRLFATASRDGSALVWDVYGLNGANQVVDLKPDELNRLWEDLAGSDGEKVTAAIGVYVKGAEKLLPFLKEKLAVDDAKTIAKWIADLDAGDFKVRTKAKEHLGKLGSQAEKPLKKALKTKNISLEMRRNIEKLLENMPKETSLSPLQIRRIRAVEALELMHTEESRKLIEKLAAGDPDILITQEAKKTLKRLGERSPR